jgi:hypothetical protein
MIGLIPSKYNNAISVCAVVLYVAVSLVLWLSDTPEIMFGKIYLPMFVVTGIVSAMFFVPAVIFFWAPDNRKSFSQLRTWNIVLLILCLFYSTITWFAVDSFLPDGIFTIEEGRYVVRNHEYVSAISSANKFYRLKKFQDLQFLAGMSVFLSFGLLFFNRGKRRRIRSV